MCNYDDVSGTKMNHLGKKKFSISYSQLQSQKMGMGNSVSYQTDKFEKVILIITKNT